MICNISNNHLRAIFCNEPIEGYQFFEIDISLGLQYIYEKLKDKGILFGLQYEVLEKIAEKKSIDTNQIVIAKGEQPINEGVELKLNFDHAKMPDLENSENADFHNLGFGVDVFEGQLLAEQHISGPGLNGKTIYGKNIPYAKSRLKPLSHNSNVIIEKSGPDTRFISKIDGVLLNNKKESLYIEPELTINGNIDFNIGNLSSNHPININGDITSGFFVRSKKDIHIKGSVEKNAIVECGGSITIDRGVNQGAHITADKNIELKFSQSSNLKAKQNITISGHCFDSTIFCKGIFTCSNELVKGDKGAVIGGNINAVEGIRLYSVGSSNANTHLISGYDYEKKQEHEKLKKLQLEIKFDLKRLIRNLSINILDKSALNELKNLNRDEKLHNLKILKQISQLKKQEIHIGTQKSALSQKKETLFLNSSIIVHNSLFPDVKININDCILNIYENYSAFEASEKNGKISIKKLAT